MDSNTLVNELYPTTQEKVGFLAGAALPVVAIIAAANSARKGNYEQAIFRALLWNGLSRNFTSSVKMKIDAHYREKQNPLLNTFNNYSR